MRGKALQALDFRYKKRRRLTSLDVLMVRRPDSLLIDNALFLIDINLQIISCILKCILSGLGFENWANQLLFHRFYGILYLHT